MAKLTGRVALVTGGGRGIGRATAIQLAKAGAKVVVTARTQDELDEDIASMVVYLWWRRSAHDHRSSLQYRRRHLHGLIVADRCDQT